MLVIASSTVLLLVNLTFAATALGVGFAAGVWVGGGRAKGSADSAESDEGLDDARRIDLERTLLASDRLRDLASAVATDVCEHSASIEQIESRLSGGKDRDAITAASIAEALHAIEAANSQLQEKLAKAEQQIQAQADIIQTHESEARTDSLTGIANRRAFDAEISRRLCEWERHATPFALLMLDIDHFKSFNDSHGHQAGDEVLRRVGACIAECVREMDLPCRYGGEEFAVVMPATEAHDGHALAERVRTAIESLSVPFEGKQLRVTGSLGLAGIRPGDGRDAILKRADDALYASKKAGRNNAHRHTGETCVPITPGHAPAAEAEPSDAAAGSEGVDTLPNRTRFLEMLRGEVRRSQQANTPLSLLTANFEAYDGLAADFGEAVARITLESLAGFLKSALRPSDLLARLEGGRLVVLMPGLNARKAEKFGEGLNAALAECTVPLGDTELVLSTAMAVTEMSPSDTATSLMQRAEASAASEAVAAPLA
ncbi:diguanylate cyclase [Botrimarina sp.]|uniref:diguanylate cyclase domain-containing protein n=1 Tax=Botrimarina sp. TaxID=2795802 RepID=UPI0032F0232D